jgi:hypothetical protein
MLNPELPEPYFLSNDKDKIKAIILGCDPTNLKYNHRFKYVFGLENSKSIYFEGIMNNLSEVGITLEDTYVQNVIRVYQEKETSQMDKEEWIRIAKDWVPKLIEELSAIPKNVPVLITSGILRDLLCNDNPIPKRRRFVLDYLKSSPILPENNVLGRYISILPSSLLLF